jgi:hypothetical protein
MMHVRFYQQATAKQALYLNKLLEKLAPKEWSRLKKAQEAGQWYQDEEDSCFLGLATIWKLQVGCHLDSKDFEFSVITCGGNFTGGKLYLPDLDLCLE